MAKFPINSIIRLSVDKSKANGCIIKILNIDRRPNFESRLPTLYDCLIIMNPEAPEKNGAVIQFYEGGIDKYGSLVDGEEAELINLLFE
jgi:hypothetical protein